MQKKPQYLTLALFIATLVVFIGGSIFLLQLIEESKEQDLGQRLLAIATTASVLIGSEELYLPDASVIKNYQQSPDYLHLLTLLRQIRIRNNLRNIVVLDREGRVLVDARQQLPAGEKHPFVEIDTVELKRAVQGEPAVTPYYRWKQEPHKRAYSPIFAPKGTLMYVLRLEASRDYFTEMQILKTHLYWVDGIGTILLAIIALIFHRLVQRLIKVEEAMSRTERLQALGTMAASVAHEIRNPLGIIRASAEELKTELATPGGDALTLIDDIIEECDRINLEVYNFLQWAHPSSSNITDGNQMSTTSVVKEVTELVKRARKVAESHSIQIQLKVPTQEVNAQIDPLAFRQVIFNLLLNAIEAISEAGSIFLNINLAGRHKEWVEIEIIDTGRGMSSKTLKRAFEPFFTTKREGTGLGLSICRRIIDQAGGKIKIQSREGKGTIVKVQLPLAR